MDRKGNLVVFESSIISKTGGDTPPKIGAHELDINPYLHGFLSRLNFLMTMDYSPWLES